MKAEETFTAYPRKKVEDQAVRHANQSYARASNQTLEDADYIQNVAKQSFIQGYNANHELESYQQELRRKIEAELFTIWKDDWELGWNNALKEVLSLLPPKETSKGPSGQDDPSLKL